MSVSTYSDPVSELLTLGEPGTGPWRDYSALGIGSEHIPDLIRMAGDEELNNADGDSPLVWAPLHAWRALGQLRAVEAIDPLLSMLQRIDDVDDDWVSLDLPDVFARIGQPAIAPLATYLRDPSHGMYARICAGRALKAIALQNPATRPACIRALTQQLENFAQNDPAVNGFVIADLIDLDARSSSLVMQRAFQAHMVDTSIAGDWEDVRLELGV